jgi:apolipoprotein N-acyltransferase
MIVACVSSLALPAVICCAVFSSTLGNVLMNRWLDRRRQRLVPRGEYIPTPSITVSPATADAPDDLRPYVGGPPVAPRRERSDIVPLEYDRHR